MWILLWLFRTPDCVKEKLKMGQSTGSCPVWIILYILIECISNVKEGFVTLVVEVIFHFCVKLVFNDFQGLFYIKYIFHKWQWKGVCSMCTHSTMTCEDTTLTIGKGSREAVSSPVWTCLWIFDNLRFCWLILSHIRVSLCFLNIPIHGTICLHLVHIMFLPCVFKGEYLKYGIDFQVLGLFFRCFWYFLFYERVHHICFSVVWNIIFLNFYNEKLLKYPFMLDVVDQLEIREVF